MQITIMNETYDFDARYAAGEAITLTAGEASQFNQVLAENLRNNFAGVLKGKGAKWTVTERKAEFSTYQKAYEFGVRSTRENDPIETAIFDLLKPLFHASLKQSGAVVSKMSADVYEKAYEKFAAPLRDKVRPMAEAKIAEDRRNAEIVAKLALDLSDII